MMTTNHRRSLFAVLALAVSATLAQAHFVFVVPGELTNGSPADAKVFLSETLLPDANIGGDIVAAAKLSARDASGKESDLALTKSPDGASFALTLPAATNVIHGVDDLGVNARGGKANWLIYYPKTIIGDALSKPVVVGSTTPVELVPGGAPGATTLDFLVDGKPKADVEVTILLPDGEDKVVKTDANGRTPPLDEAGRYGAWARDWLETPGEQDGKKYEQVRRYATIVFDVPGTPPAKKASTQPASAAANPHGGAGGAPRAGFNPHAAAPAAVIVKASPFRVALPEAASSFGAVASDGWLYVYGGHIVPTHEYSTKAVSGRMSRLDLTDGTTWQDLPGGPPAQGLNLAAHGGKIYRVGGMQPINEPGTPVNNRSLVDAAAFDPATLSWQALPPLPEPRSSHDVAVIGNTLYVVGGWWLEGSMTDAKKWMSTMLSLDLDTPGAQWKSIPQPFERRALIAAVHDGKLVVLGGFDSDNRPSRRVDIYNPATGTWSRGAGLPGAAMNGFSPAACVQDNALFVSVFDGSLYRLNDDENIWEPVATSTPRIVHRLVPFGSKILILGGANEGENFNLIEQVTLPAKQPAVAVVPPTPATAAVASTTQPTAAVQPSAQPTATELAAASAAGIQKFCPIMKDQEVDATSYVVMYHDKPVLLCCKKCVAKWNANPEKYADVALIPQLATVK